MNDTIASRVSRIISGSLRSLVQSVESAVPEAVMEEAIREVDGAIDEVRGELGRVIAGKHLASTRLMDENRKHESLVEQIEVAIQQGRDDLAEAAIATQLDIEAQIPILEHAIADSSGKEKELEGYVRALQGKKREMEQEMRNFIRSRKEAAGSSASAPGTSSGSAASVESRVERASGAFGRVIERATGLGSGVAPDSTTAARLAELEDLTRKNRIQERLAAIKKSQR